MWRSLANALPAMARDLVGIAGATLASYGAWMVYPPAGFIVGGTLLVVGVCLSAKASG